MNKIKLCKEIHETAVDKGFWDSKRNHQELFMLIITELAEAVEAHRKDKFADEMEFENLISDYTQDTGLLPIEQWVQLFDAHIRGTVEEELADTWIRCADYLYYKFEDNILFYHHNYVKWKDNFAENCLKISKSIITWDIEHAMDLIQSLCNHMDIDLEWFIVNKMKYNKTRDKLHGKAY